MKQHQLPDQTPPPSTADAPNAVWTAWVREHWGAVRVIQLDTNRHLADDAPSQARVRAVVHLGLLSPADVHVDATADVPNAAGATDQSVIELWSAQSYRNGTFVFEALVPAEALDEHGALTVCVRPRGGHEDLLPLRAVARPSDVGPSSSSSPPAPHQPRGAPSSSPPRRT
jgi:hypothetical protein